MHATALSHGEPAERRRAGRQAVSVTRATARGQGETPEDVPCPLFTVANTLASLEQDLLSPRLEVWGKPATKKVKCGGHGQA